MNHAEEAAAGPVRPMGDAPRFIAPTHSGVDILKLLKELEDLIENTRRGPLGMLLGFNEDKFHMTVMKIRANLPEEMKRASKLANEGERIVDEAHSNAGRVVEEARHAALLEIERSKTDASQLRDETRRSITAEQENARKEILRIKENAQIEADRIIAEAHERAGALVEQDEIVRRAHEEAAAKRAAADSDAATMRHGAEDYARDLLSNLEEILSKAATQVQRGRDMLQ